MRRPGLLFKILVRDGLRTAPSRDYCGPACFCTTDIEAEKVAWESSKKKLDQVEIDDMRIQNKMLHDQMASLS